VNLGSPSISIVQLNLQATCAFRFMCRHTVVNKM